MDPIQPSKQESVPQPIQPTVPTFVYDNKNLLFILVVLLVGVLFGFLFAKQQPIQEKQSLTLVGNATLEVQADTALIEAATEATSPDYNKAIEDNKKKVEEVKKALKSAGLPDKNFKIVNSYTDQDYDYTDADNPNINPNNELPKYYYAITSFEITFEKNTMNTVEKYIRLLDELNTDPYVTYTLKNRNQYNSTLQQEAVNDARKQAEGIAKANKVSIKKVVSIQDRSLQANSENNFYEDATLGSDSPTLELSASYEVQYELGANLFPL